LNEAYAGGGVADAGDDAVDFGERVVEGGLGGIALRDLVERGLGLANGGIGGGAQLIGRALV
jgi:hypothetical protein